MDHDLGTLTALADAAAEVGVERFVLDDGWFRGRRTDLAGLGDWEVDPEVWPEGLHPLVDHVKRLGLDFGLWVEPEMVNDDSDLARAHPEWVLRGRSSAAPEWRHQQVLDLQQPGAYAHVRDQLMALLDAYDIAFLKWDHNRDLVDVAHAGRPAAHGQTVAFYRLLDELRAARPDLEIESCASGGGRVDLEVLMRTDRVWPSDTIDAVERQRIQRWTSLLVPPELLGAHLGGPVAHTTGRRHGTGFRAATALLGHFGIEWDLRGLDAVERAEVAAWVALHKELRPLVSTGRLVRGDHADPAVLVTGVVAPDRCEAWFVVATVDTTVTQSVGAVLLPGLDPDRTYLVADRTPSGDGHRAGIGSTWIDGDGVVLGGRALAEVGVRLPATAPETARVLRVTSR
jgi:alpha-galactosidase